MKKIILILLIILITVGCSCGHIKNQREMARWVKKQYGITPEIISFDGNNTEGREFVFKNTKRDFIFYCSSSFEEFGIDNGTLGNFEKTDCDYYSRLTEYLGPQMIEIEDNYSVKLFQEDNSRVISYIEIPVFDEKNIDKSDLTNAINAFNELNKLYDFQTNVKFEKVFIYLYNSEPSNYYFEYTKKGEEAVLKDSHSDFYTKNKIPLQMEKNALDYANSIYGGGFEVIDYRYVSNSDSGFGYNTLSYVVYNEDKDLYLELGFYIDKYVKDYNKNNIKSMDNYYDESIKVDWYRKYQFD